MVVLRRVAGQPDDGVGAEDPSRHRRREVVLAEVDAVGARREGHVRPVVHDEQRAVPIGGIPEHRGVAEQVAGLGVLVAELHDVDAGRKNRVEEVGKVRPSARDDVQTRCSEPFPPIHRRRP